MSTQNSIYFAKTHLASLGVTNTQTKASWCLQKGLEHVCTVDGGKLAPLVQQHGAPGFYSCIGEGKKCRHDATQDLKDPSTCFQSLCRTIAGQFVSGSSAQAAWRRLLESTNDNLTPETIMALVSKRKKVDEGLLESRLQKPVGLTKTKAKSIVDLATHFTNGSLSEEFLKTSDEHALRKALLKVKGVGPWSCDMFLIFYLELPDILPLGDLGVRKGISIFFSIKGSGKKSSLCEKKDKQRIEERLSIYGPYRSLMTYYMWRAADTKIQGESDSKPKEAKKSSQKRQLATSDAPQTPDRRKRAARKVTP